MINRRNLIKLLGLGVATPMGGRIAAHFITEQRPLTLLHTPVNGMAYYEGTRDVVEALRPGETLRLQREPGNAYDENAIEVCTQMGLKLGYVPRVHNAVLANLADQKWALRAELDALEPERWPYDCLRITIYGRPS